VRAINCRAARFEPTMTATCRDGAVSHSAPHRGIFGCAVASTRDVQAIHSRGLPIMSKSADRRR
jgi:hypothetical protein